MSALTAYQPSSGHARALDQKGTIDMLQGNDLFLRENARRLGYKSGAAFQTYARRSSLDAAKIALAIVCALAGLSAAINLAQALDGPRRASVLVGQGCEGGSLIAVAYEESELPPCVRIDRHSIR